MKKIRIFSITTPQLQPGQLHSLLLCLQLLFTAPLLQAQVVVGGNTPPAPSAALDLRSNNGGLLIPRMTTAERDAIASPATGLLIYNTSLHALEMNAGSDTSPEWTGLSVAGSAATVDCAGASLSRSLMVNTEATGTTLTIAYTGGNGEYYRSQSVASAGITGLTASLTGGYLADGNGSLVFNLSGTPAMAGTVSFTLLVGGHTCTVDLPALLVGTLSELSCSTATTTGNLAPGVAAANVSTSVPYVGGNGGVVSGQTVASTGVTGLTATLSESTLVVGSGSLVYTISGTPIGAGTASFALQVGGQSCTFSLKIACGAYVASGQWKEFMCHNLGAVQSAAPFTPSWELTGNYYQWGRNPTCFGRDGTDATNACSSPVYGAAAPWGNATSNDNAGSITGWSTTTAGATALLDESKTANDPCPAGFRIPTRTQWTGVINSSFNSRTFVGTWTDSSTNFSSGVKFGDVLFLQSAGRRSDTNGSLSLRGANGFYLTSTASDCCAYALRTSSSTAITNLSLPRLFGASVRCIAE